MATSCIRASSESGCTRTHATCPNPETHIGIGEFIRAGGAHKVVAESLPDLHAPAPAPAPGFFSHALVCGSDENALEQTCSTQLQQRREGPRRRGPASIKGPLPQRKQGRVRWLGEAGRRACGRAGGQRPPCDDVSHSRPLRRRLKGNERSAHNDHVVPYRWQGAIQINCGTENVDWKAVRFATRAH